MPNGFGYGTNRAFKEVVGGIITSIIIVAISGSGLLPPSYILLFNLLNMFGTIAMILVMPYWGTTYLIGWLFGLILLSNTGLISILDFIIYFGVPLAILIIRLAKSLGYESNW